MSGNKISENRRLYRQIADQISKRIVDREFSLGGRLPSERDLAEQHGVSRPTVREALIALEVEGIVEVRVGTGIFIRKMPVMDSADDVANPFEVMQARVLLECEAARLAARRASNAQLATMRAAVERLDQNHTYDCTVVDADSEFHLAIVDASGNLALKPLIEQLWNQRRGAAFRQLEASLDGPALLTDLRREHADILQAIERRDGDAAEQLMRRHLEAVERRLQAATPRVDNAGTSLDGEADRPLDGTEKADRTP